MLVLSRRSREAVVFPTIGVTVQILRVAGKVVRLGIEAPRSIPVLRTEVDITGPKSNIIDAINASRALTVENHTLTGSEDEAREQRHRLRGRLNTATVAIHLAEKQLLAGMTKEADNTLQRALRELQDLDDALQSPNQTRLPAGPARRLRALLVEDNAYESSLLESYLRMSGLDVIKATDGQEALEYLSSHEIPDVVLLDMHMPRFDGPSTLAAIRSNPALARLKVYAVTGSKPEELGSSVKVDGWFSKPLNPGRLVDTLLQSAS